jgi:hypothetical protein
VTGFGGPDNLSTGSGGEINEVTIPDYGKYLIPLKPGYITVLEYVNSV